MNTLTLDAETRDRLVATGLPIARAAKEIPEVLLVAWLPGGLNDSRWQLYVYAPDGDLDKVKQEITARIEVAKVEPAVMGFSTQFCVVHEQYIDPTKMRRLAVLRARSLENMLTEEDLRSSLVLFLAHDTKRDAQSRVVVVNGSREVTEEKEAAKVGADMDVKSLIPSVEKKVMYVASDGQAFDSEGVAEWHEIERCVLVLVERHEHVDLASAVEELKATENRKQALISLIWDLADDIVLLRTRLCAWRDEDSTDRKEDKD